MTPSRGVKEPIQTENWHKLSQNCPECPQNAHTQVYSMPGWTQKGLTIRRIGCRTYPKTSNLPARLSRQDTTLVHDKYPADM